MVDAPLGDQFYLLETIALDLWRKFPRGGLFVVGDNYQQLKETDHVVSCRSHIHLWLISFVFVYFFIAQALSPVESLQPPCHHQSVFPGTMDASEHSWLIFCFEDHIRISSVVDQGTAC